MNLNDKRTMTLLLGVCLSLFLAFAIIGVGMKAVVNRAADTVIEKLQREYTPGPYQPGFDPDKVDPSVFRQSGTPKSEWDSSWSGLR
jgi:hypothetical protein